MKELIIATVIMAALAGLTGCAHNINAQGLYAACPYGAIGYGTFTCSKDNVKVKSTKDTAAGGVKTTNEFTVGKQTTGYDVELAEVSKK